MSKPYDAVTKRLIEMRPADWVAFLRLPPGDVSLVDADLSTITLYADRIIRVDTDDGAYLVHNELESGKDTAGVPLRLFHYNASAVYKTQLPVISTVFLLQKESNSPRITGANEAVKKQLLQGVRRMRESSTYQEILREGRSEGQLEEARRILLRQGMRRLGIAPPATEARVQGIVSLTVLEDLLDRVHEVETWDDLLARMS